MNLDECLEKYKNMTLELIDKVKQTENLDELLNERSKIIDKISDFHFSKEEFKGILDSLNILELDNKLQALVESEKMKTKNQIDILRKTREAKKNYDRVQEKPRLFTARS